MQPILESLREMSGSKKALAIVLAIAITLWGAKVGMSSQDAQNTFYALLAYTGAQSIADFGKEAKKA